MNRVNEADVRVARGQARNSLANALETIAEVLPAVAGDQDEPTRAQQRFRETRHGDVAGAEDSLRQQQCINRRVTSDVDPVWGHPLRQQVQPAPRCRGKVQVCEVAGEHAVSFLGPRCFQVKRPQACLNVPDGHAAVKRGQRRGKHGRCVPLNKDQAWPLLGIYPVQPDQCSRGKIRQRLVGQHQIQIHVRANPERLKDLVKHLPMLRGDHDGKFHGVRSLKSADDGDQLNGFRARPESDHHPRPAH